MQRLLTALRCWLCRVFGVVPRSDYDAECEVVRHLMEQRDRAEERSARLDQQLEAALLDVDRTKAELRAIDEKYRTAEKILDDTFQPRYACGNFDPPSLANRPLRTAQPVFVGEAKAEVRSEALQRNRLVVRVDLPVWRPERPRPRFDAEEVLQDMAQHRLERMMATAVNDRLNLLIAGYGLDGC